MAVTASDIKTLGGSAFSGIADARVNLFLGIAKHHLHESTWGDLYEDGLKLATLHFLASDPELAGNAKGVGGEVSSMSVESVSISFATGGKPSDAEFGSTFWGRQFLALRRSLFGAPIVAVD